MKIQASWHHITTTSTGHFRRAERSSKTLEAELNCTHPQPWDWIQRRTDSIDWILRVHRTQTRTKVAASIRSQAAELVKVKTQQSVGLNLTINEPARGCYHLACGWVQTIAPISTNFGLGRALNLWTILNPSQVQVKSFGTEPKT